MSDGRGFKLKNGYQKALGDMYAETPKAVFAALAVSLIMQLDGDDSPAGRIRNRLLGEWTVLHQNGIVPQKPNRKIEK